MKTRFDLEDAISRVRDIEDDIEAFLQMYMDGPTRMSQDEVWNYLSGIKHVFQLRNGVLWDTFKQVHGLDEYSKYKHPEGSDVFWQHDCPEEGMVGVGKGYECPRCGAKEGNV